MVVVVLVVVLVMMVFVLVVAVALVEEPPFLTIHALLPFVATASVRRRPYPAHTGRAIVFRASPRLTACFLSACLPAAGECR